MKNTILFVAILQWLLSVHGEHHVLEDNMREEISHSDQEGGLRRKNATSDELALETKLNDFTLRTVLVSDVKHIKQEQKRKLEDKCKVFSASTLVMIFGSIAIIGPWVFLGLLAILDPGICNEGSIRLGAFLGAIGLILLIGGGIGAGINGLYDCD